MKYYRIFESYYGYILFGTTLITFGSVWFWGNGHEYIFHALTVISVFIIYPGVFVIALTKFKNMHKYTVSLKNLFILYFEVILAFTGVYFWFVLLTNGNAFYGFDNIKILQETKESFDSSAYIYNLWVLIVDAFHFSVVTATTLGYGDIRPNWPSAKLLVDAQVLISLGIAIFGAGMYFESRQRKMEKKVLWY